MYSQHVSLLPHLVVEILLMASKFTAFFLPIFESTFQPNFIPNGHKTKNIRQHNPPNPKKATQHKHSNMNLLTLTSISATIISTSESSRTMFVNDACYWKSVLPVALWAIGPNVGKPLKCWAVLWELRFIPLLLTSWPKLLDSHGACRLVKTS